ncbi:hypothetical protein E3N88_37358 [Mikania micrantha]|uniref:SHSP domain-containing protein n=1 Tax=Mikania micrantha TaxID=192012 RepID=A0A5N6LQZ9_9ASTR|nr:hypothetical protein E3N88_37358 [Mikania micrantha]
MDLVPSLEVQPQSQSSVQSSLRSKKDITWKYVTEAQDETGRKFFTCTFCDNTFRGGGINRMKQHLAGIKGNVATCLKVPPDVKFLMKNVFEGSSQKGKEKRCSELNEDEEAQTSTPQTTQKKRKTSTTPGNLLSYFSPGMHNVTQPSIKERIHTTDLAVDRASTKTPQQKQPIKKRVVQPTPIVVWDGFPTARTVQQMMDTMETLMEEPPSYDGSLEPQDDSTGSYSRGRTPWEIKGGEEDYKMRFDMPGMTKEDVKVWVEEKMLVLKAEKVKKDNNGESVDDHDWSPESFGKYSFRIGLPENIQFENIKAEVRDGVLYVTIPKAPVSSKILDINVQ